MEYPRCALCGSDDREILLDKLDMGRGVHGKPRIIKSDGKPVNYRHVCCKDCGLVYLHPRMSFEENIKFYRETYRRHYTTGTKEEKSHSDFPWLTHSHLALEIYNAIDRMQALSRHGLLKGRLEVLDVGSSLGAVVASLRAAGHRAWGIEISPFGSYSKELFDLDKVVQIPLEQFETPVRFDRILLCDGLEHYVSPVKALRKIRSILKNDGKVLFELPDIQVPHARPDGFLSNAHVTMFSETTLRRLLEREGFEVLTMDHTAPYRNLRVVAAKAEPKPHVEGRDDPEAHIDFYRRYAELYDHYIDYLEGTRGFPEAAEKRDALIRGFRNFELVEAHRVKTKDRLRAIQLMEDYLRFSTFEEDPRFSTGNVQAEVAGLFLELGDKDSARAYLEQARTIMPAFRDFPATDKLHELLGFDLTATFHEMGLRYDLLSDSHGLRTPEREQSGNRGRTKGAAVCATHLGSALSYFDVGEADLGFESLMRAYDGVGEEEKKGSNDSYLRILALTARYYLERGRPDRASRYVEEGLAAKADHLDLLFLKAVMLMDEQRYDETALALVSYLAGLDLGGATGFTYDLIRPEVDDVIFERLLPTAFRGAVQAVAIRRTVEALGRKTSGGKLLRAAALLARIEAGGVPT